MIFAISCVATGGRAGASMGPTLCTGYAPCNSSGYSSHGYDDTTNRIRYWGADPGHNCTNYVAYVESHTFHADDPGTGLGDAETWGLRAPDHGAVVNSQPSAGAVAWWDHDSPFGSAGGHVAIVESYTSSSITVSEDNFRGDYDWRTYTTSGSPSYWPTGFIHFKGVVNPNQALIWAVKTTGKLYWNRGGKTWTHIGDGWAQVSVGSDGTIWAVTTAGKLYWNRGGKTWTHIGDGWAQVAVGSAGNIWAVTTAGKLYWYRGGKTWTHIGDGWAQVGVGSDSSGHPLIWAVTTADKLYWYRGGKTWTHIGDGWAQVGVGSDGTIWAVTTANKLYWNRGGKTWTHIDDGWAQVGVGSASNIWAVTTAGKLYWNRGGKTWTHIDDGWAQVGVGST